MNRKVCSVLVFPYPDGVRVEITRQIDIFDVSKGRLTRYYHAHRKDLKKLKSLVKWAAKLDYLMLLRIADRYN